MSNFLRRLLRLLGLMPIAEHRAVMAREAQRAALRESSWEMAVEQVHASDARVQNLSSLLQSREEEAARLRLALRAAAEGEDFEPITAGDLLADTVDLEAEAVSTTHKYRAVTA